MITGFAAWSSTMRRLRSDDEQGSADPILVIAAVAVSLILLVAGTFNIHGVAMNSADKTARNDLSLLAAAESTYFAAQQTYVNYDSMTNPAGLAGGGIGYSPAEHSAVIACGSGWVAAVLSTSGTVITETNMNSAFGDSTGVGLTLPSCAASDIVTNVVGFVTGGQTMSACTAAPTPTQGLAGTTTSSSPTSYTVTGTFTAGAPPTGWNTGSQTIAAGTAITNVRVWIDGVEYCGVAAGALSQSLSSSTYTAALTLNLSTLDTNFLTRFQASGRVQFDTSSTSNNTIRL